MNLRTALLSMAELLTFGHSAIASNFDGTSRASASGPQIPFG
jgi:hypothetical protein